MLIIDPNLHNPTINGMQLIVNNRINPKIALAQEDIYGSDGVIVEKFQDGTIMISADISSINDGEYKKYVNIYEIDFMKNLPSVLYKFLNPLFSGVNVGIFYSNNYSLSKNVKSFMPSGSYKYDINGNVEQIEEEYFGNVSVVSNLNETEYEQFLSFEFNDNYVHEVETSYDEDFLNVIEKKTFAGNLIEIQLQDYNSGMIYWRARGFDRKSFIKTYYEYGSFDFVKKEYQYPYEASPLNISSNNDGDWTVDQSSFYDGQYGYFAFNENDSVFHSNTNQPHWISWKNNNRRVLIGKISITSSNDSYWSSSLSSLKLQGSDNGSMWTDIQTLNGQYGSATTHEFVINNKTPYYYHRLYSLSPNSYMTIKFIRATRE